MMRFEAIENDRIFLIHDFLSPDECERHIARSEAVGYETFTIDGEVLHGYRDNGRVIVDDPDLADGLWSGAAEHLPAKIESKSVSGLNPRFRYYRYTGSEAFAPHYDGFVRIGNCTSQLTLLVYLSNVTKGGETRFYGEDLVISHSIRPTLGTALVFVHSILHEGVAVEDGTKYVLRTDVMYR